MAESKTSDKAALESAVTEHLIANGSADWTEVRARFPGVSDSTFWRVVRAQKKAVGSTGKDGKAVAKVVKKAREVGANLPAPVVESIGHGKVSVTIDYLDQLNRVMTAAVKLEEFSLNKEGGVRVPKFYLDAARLRLESLKTYAAVASFLDGKEKQEEMWRVVLDEIGQESPELQVRILRRLHAVSQRFGLAASMGMA